MLVTKISVQQKDQDRANIFIDGQYRLSLTFGQLLDTKLKVGTELDERQVKELEQLSADGKLQARTLEWLLLRPRSRHELLQYLHRKQVDDTVAASWADHYQKLGYQDDQYFATWWVTQRRTGKMRSSRFIRAELRSKGIDDYLITDALAQNDETDNSVLRELIKKKRNQSRYKDTDALRIYLQRQGYGYSDIVRALAEEEGE